MTLADEPLVIAAEVAAHMERIGIQYLLGGSLASTLHGEPRATLDVDFAVHMNSEQARRLSRALEDDFHVMPNDLEEAAIQGRMANVIHKRPYLKIDFHFRSDSGHSREEMRRAQRIQIGESDPVTLRVATPEDIVLQKLRWYRLGGEVSDRQWRDVLGVLKLKAASIDLVYMRSWSRTLEVEDLLAKATAQSGLS